MYQVNKIKTIVAPPYLTIRRVPQLIERTFVSRAYLKRSPQNKSESISEQSQLREYYQREQLKAFCEQKNINVAINEFISNESQLANLYNRELNWNRLFGLFSSRYDATIEICVIHYLMFGSRNNLCRELQKGHRALKTFLNQWKYSSSNNECNVPDNQPIIMQIISLVS